MSLAQFLQSLRAGVAKMNFISFRVVFISAIIFLNGCSDSGSKQLVKQLTYDEIFLYQLPLDVKIQLHGEIPPDPYHGRFFQNGTLLAYNRVDYDQAYCGISDYV